MGRFTVYNNITSEEKIKNINPDNIYIKNEFLDYLRSVNRATSTIKQYDSMLNIFFVWNLENNNNKEFTTITKREFAKFQNHTLNEWEWSPKRIRTVKAAISSLSNFIENIMDEEEGYENYRAIIRKIENPANDVVREKSVFEKGELQELLDKLVENNEYEKACMLSLAMCSGRRKQELTRFKLSYFDDRNVIYGSLYKTPEKVTSKGRGKNGKQIYFYVLKNDFDPYLALWVKQREELGIDSEWLFPNKINPDEHIHIGVMDSWAAQFSNALKKSFYWHAMRHFFTTECVRKNLPTNVIQEIISWESADMVRLYTDISTDDILGKYFDENGIKDIQSATLSDL